MRLKLERTWCGKACTIGTLSVDGRNECFTLEDVRREISDRPVSDWKVPGSTAIPEGAYNILVTRSERFSRIASKKAGKPVDVFTPLLENVPGFSGIRIHPGNGPEDTEGCILVGAAKGPDQVTHSREAFDALFKKIREALGCGEKVTIEVVG